MDRLVSALPLPCPETGRWLMLLVGMLSDGIQAQRGFSMAWEAEMQKGMPLSQGGGSGKVPKWGGGLD